MSTTPRRFQRTCGGFSLIEVVIVVTIIGIISSVAILKFSRGGAAAADSVFTANLNALRRAIDLYHVEHAAFPTCVLVSGGKTTIMFQLTQYTDASGNYSAVRSATHVYGPYLRDIPELMVGTDKDRRKINTADDNGVGWIYNPSTGEIRANTGTAADAKGRLYSDY